MDKPRGPGRPQGDLKGTTPEANELAVFLRQVTQDQTVRQLAVRYMGGRTAWSLYRSGAQVIPWHLLEKVVLDRVPDRTGRDLLLTRARALHGRATDAEDPAAEPPQEVDPLPGPVVDPAEPPSGRPADAVVGRWPWRSHAVVAAVAVVIAVAATLVVGQAVSPPASTGASSSTADTARVAEALVAISPSGDAVNSWNPRTGRWTRIGGPAAEVHGGGAGLFAVSPGAGHIVRYQAPDRWTYIGERSAELAVGRDHVYRLAPDRAAVWEWIPQPGSWLLIGGPARHVHAGRAGMFASGQSGHDLFRYDGTPGNWTWLTDTLDPEDQVVVGRETFYRLTADRDAVHEWDQSTSTWLPIGGPAKSIHAGDAGLFLVDPTGALLAYRGEPGEWEPLGDAGADVVVASDRVYRVMPDGALAQWFSGTWTDLADRGSLITATGR